MTSRLSEEVLPTLQAGLTTLQHLLVQAASHAEENGFDVTNLLTARLAPDMFSFTGQIQIATDLVRRGLDRLEGKEVTSRADEETTVAQLSARVAADLERLAGADTAVIDAVADQIVQVPMGKDATVSLVGSLYVRDFLVPNFYFHITTAYALLRQNGVPLGKRDFLMAFLGRHMGT